MNLMQKVSTNKIDNSLTDPSAVGSTKAFRQYISANSPSQGLLGVITSCNVNYNLEGADGVFEKQGAAPVPGGGAGTKSTILPKLIDINISFSPLHEKTLGYGDGIGINSFPYGLSGTGDETADIGFAETARANASRRSAVQQMLIDSGLEPNPSVAPPPPRGKSLAELIALKKTLEEKRRTAASAQQERDKELAAYRKAERKISRKERRGKISELEAETQRFEAADGLSDLVNNASAASEELQNLEDLLG